MPRVVSPGKDNRGGKSTTSKARATMPAPKTLACPHCGARRNAPESVNGIPYWRCASCEWAFYSNLAANYYFYISGLNTSLERDNDANYENYDEGVGKLICSNKTQR